MTKRILLFSILLLIHIKYITCNEIFLSAQYLGCNLTCSGTYSQPYDSLISLLFSQNNTQNALTIIFIPDLIQKHYILGGEYAPNDSIYYNYTISTNPNMDLALELYFNSLIIKPLFCDEYPIQNYPNCIAKDQVVYINLKFLNFKIFCGNVSFMNIVLDGMEDIYNLNVMNGADLLKSLTDTTNNQLISQNLTKCLYTRINCCENYDSLTGFSTNFPDIKCTRPNLQISLMMNPINLTMITMKSCIFNVDNMGKETSLALINTTIRNFWMPLHKTMFLIVSDFAIIISNGSIESNIIMNGLIQAEQISGNFSFKASNYIDYPIKFNPNIDNRLNISNNTLFKYNSGNNNQHYMNVNINNSKFSLSNIFASFIIENQKTSLGSASFYMQNTAFFGDLTPIKNHEQYTIQTSFYLQNLNTVGISNSSFDSIIQPLTLSNCINISFDNINFTNNINFYGGGAFIQNTDQSANTPYSIDIIDCIFNYNQAIRGGGLYFQGQYINSQIQITNSIFQNNIAMSSIGGAIVFLVGDPYGNSSLIIQNSKFLNNSGEFGGAIFVKFDLISSAGAFKPQIFNLTLNNNNFLGNKAQILNFTNLIDESYLKSLLPLQTPNGGAGFVICQGLCNINLDSNIFTENTAVEGSGGALFISESQISNCQFKKNTALYGGAISAIRFNSLIDPTSMFKLIQNLFDSNKAKQSNSILKIPNENSYGYGGAISIPVEYESTPFDIINCIFMSNTATFMGGAIQGGPFIINSSNFANNSANLGGAFYGIKAIITSCIFTGNKALNSSNLSLLGKGGAIYLDNEPISSTSALFTSIFQDNSADMSGGAIYYKSTTIPLIDFNSLTFTNNTAMIYGNSIAAYPIRLVSSISDYIETINYTSTINTSSIENSYYGLNIASGEFNQSVLFILLDMYGQIVKDDSFSQLILQPIYESSTKPQIPLVYYPSSIVASHGIYELNTLTEVIYEPGLELNVSIISNAITTSPWNNYAVIVNLVFNYCQPGEIFQKTYCEKCNPGYYSLENYSYYTGLCYPCEINALCLGGNIMVPTPGYWRKNSTANLIIRCPSQYACLGSSTDLNYFSINGNCSRGYEGNLCGICSQGYGKVSTSFKCYDCYQDWWYYISIILCFLIKVILYVYTIKMTLRYLKDMENKLIEKKIVLMKILMNYLQMITILQKFHINWLEVPYEIIDILARISIDLSDILFIDCYLNNYQLINKFYLKSTISLTIPTILLLILFSIITLPYSLLKHKLNAKFLKKICNHLEQKNREYSNIFFMILIYSYQDMIQNVLNFMQCRNLYRSDNPEYYLYNEPNIQCWQLSHFKWTFIVALLVFSFWGILMPYYVYRKIQSSSLLTFQNIIFLTIGYKPNIHSKKSDLYFMQKRLIMTLSASLLSLLSPLLSLILCIAIIIINLLIQYKYIPFKNAIDNHIENQSLLSILTLYYALICNQTNGILIFDILIICIICFSIIGFIGFWIIHFLRILALTRNGKYCKIILKFLKDPENLAEKHALDDIRNLKSEVEILQNQRSEPIIEKDYVSRDNMDNIDELDRSIFNCGSSIDERAL